MGLSNTQRIPESSTKRYNVSILHPETGEPILTWPNVTHLHVWVSAPVTIFVSSTGSKTWLCSTPHIIEEVTT